MRSHPGQSVQAPAVLTTALLELHPTASVPLWPPINGPCPQAGPALPCVPPERKAYRSSFLTSRARWPLGARPPRETNWAGCSRGTSLTRRALQGKTTVRTGVSSISGLACKERGVWKGGAPSRETQRSSTSHRGHQGGEDPEENPVSSLC